MIGHSGPFFEESVYKSVDEYPNKWMDPREIEPATEGKLPSMPPILSIGVV